MWRPQPEPGSSVQNLWWGLYEMVSECLRGRLGEHGLFPEVTGEMAVGLGGIKGGLGEVAPGGSAAPGRGVAVMDTRHQQQHLGHRG